MTECLTRSNCCDCVSEDGAAMLSGVAVCAMRAGRWRPGCYSAAQIFRCMVPAGPNSFHCSLCQSLAPYPHALTVYSQQSQGLPLPG